MFLSRRTPQLSRGESLAVGIALLGLMLRLWIAASTFGTNDMHYWAEFAHAVDRFGPVGIYGHDEFAAQYNHPPLIGLFLLLVNALVSIGLPFTLVMRIPSCLADAATCWLLFRMVSDRLGERAGLSAALTFALSPAAVVVAGFHGNTDPVFVSLALAACWLLPRRPLAAGVALALAMSIKVVPVVAVPALVIAAFRQDVTHGRRLVIAFVSTAALTWGPAVVLAPTQVFDQVIAYRGINFTEWGIPEFLRWASAGSAAQAYAEHAGLPLAAAVATGAGWLVWRARTPPATAVGIGLCAFLVFTPAFAMQYLVWPLAFAYTVSLRLAVISNAAISIFVLVVYSHWNGAWPGNWFEARATPFWRVDLPLMCLSWLTLVALLSEAVGLSSRRARAGR